MLAEHAKLMKPQKSEPMTDEEFDRSLDIIRRMGLPDVKS